MLSQKVLHSFTKPGLVGALGWVLGLLAAGELTACRSAPEPRARAEVAQTAPLAPTADPLAASVEATKQQRRVHLSFLEDFQAFEKEQVGAFWRCLFGKDGDGRRFNMPEALNAVLESQLYGDPKTFPDKVRQACIPAAQKASASARTLTAPPAYTEALSNYATALDALATGLAAWADRAPERVAIMQRKQRVQLAGEQWSSTANPNKADPVAWQYDKFLHCTVPELDKFLDGQAVLEFLAGRCIGQKGVRVDTEFLARLRDTCIPEAQTPPTKAPPNFKRTFDKFAEDYDRLAQAFGSCFRKMNKESKKDDFEQFDQAWASWINSGTEVRKIGKQSLCESGSETSCDVVSH